jgi:hypothetical protein
LTIFGYRYCSMISRLVKHTSFLLALLYLDASQWRQ